MGDNLAAATGKFRRAAADPQSQAIVGLCEPRSSGSNCAIWRSARYVPAGEK